MKTLRYMSLLALAAGLTACSQYEEPNPKTPVTSQPEQFMPGTNGVEITPSQYVSAYDVTDEPKNINLITYSEIGFDIPMADISLAEAEIPEGYNLSYVMYVADNDQYDNQIEVPSVVKDGVIYTTAEALQKAHDDLWSPVEADDVQMWARYAAFVSNDNVQNVRLGSADTWFALSTFMLTPQPVKIECLYTPGDANGWNQGSSQKIGTYPTNDKWTEYVNYQGFANLSGSFKFTSALDWNGINFGDGGEAGALSTDPGAGNLSVAAPGFYWVSVNISALTWQDPVEITTAGIIGSATPGGWDAETNLTPSADMLTWTGTIAMTAGEYKFRFNNGGDINLGGSLDKLQFDGSNITIDEAGTYDVNLDLSNLPYTATLVKK